MNLTKEQITIVAQGIGLDYATFMAFIITETGAEGVDPKTGKVIIRFEPTWFVKYAKIYGFSDASWDGKTLTLQGKTHVVMHDKQDYEWQNFNFAFLVHPKCTMLATSWGIMQVMGFNFSTCGFATVDDFVDAMKSGELKQLQAAAEYILHNRTLLSALKAKDWATSAKYYNGSDYAKNRYDIHLQNNYNKYLNA